MVRTAKLARGFFALLVMISSVSIAAVAMDEVGITREMFNRFKAAAPSLSFKITAPRTVQIKGKQLEFTVSLDRVILFCSANSVEECEKVKRDFISKTVSSLSSYTLKDESNFTRTQLVVAVRNTSNCREMEKGLSASPKASEAILRPLAEGLCAVLQFDFPTTRRIASVADLTKLGLARDAAWTLAQAQTLKTLPKLTEVPAATGGLYAVMNKEDAPSLMLDANAWRQLATQRGSLLVMVPSDNFLIFVSEKDAHGIAGLRDATEKNFAAAERGVSPLVYRWTNEGWQTVR